MNKKFEVEESIKQMLSKIKLHGVKADVDSLEWMLDSKYNIPNWFVDLFVTYPLGGIQIGIEIDDEPLMFELLNSDLLQEFNFETYPSMYILSKGYLTIGYGVESAGDVLVVDIQKKELPVFQVWHDISHDGDEIAHAISNGEPGTQLISAQLAELFGTGLVEEPL